MVGGSSYQISVTLYPGSLGMGGAWYIDGGLAGVTNCTFEANHAVGGSNNGAPVSGGMGLGGGLCVVNAASVSVLNSTFAGNVARGSASNASGDGQGGGMYNKGGAVLLAHVTVADNAARRFNGTVGASQGGGIFSTNGTVTLQNTIVANSLSGSNWFGATIVDEGNNISSDASCNFSAPGSLNNTDPVLGPLADYGGPTPTVALLAGSPALDAANPAFCPPADQRGLARPFGAGCHIGAFESAPPYTILGQITGYTTSPGGISVSAGSNSSQPDSSGTYNLSGFPMGTYVVKPAASDAVFILSNRVVTVGPDIVNVNFHSYRSNALTIEPVSSQTFRSVFAGAAGDTWRVLASSNLLEWAPVLTNTVPASGIFEFIETNNPSNPSRFFQTIKP